MLSVKEQVWKEKEIESWSCYAFTHWVHSIAATKSKFYRDEIWAHWHWVGSCDSYLLDYTCGEYLEYRHYIKLLPFPTEDGQRNTFIRLFFLDMGLLLKYAKDFIDLFICKATALSFISQLYAFVIGCSL